MAAPDPAPSLPVHRVARLLGSVVVVVVAAFVLETLVRSAPTFDTAWDGWVQGAGYVLVAAYAAIRPLTSGYHRLLWSLVAVALALRAFAFVAYLAVIRTQVPPPYPSVADVGWLAMSVVLLVALTLLVPFTSYRLSVALLLDAVLVGLTVAGVAVALLYDTLVSLSAPGLPADAVATNLAYPVLDISLLVVVGGVMSAYRWRASPSTMVLAAGVVGFAVVDTVFLYQVSAGSYRPGTIISALSLVATAAIAVASRLPEEQRPLDADEPPPGFAVPALFALVCVICLVYAAAQGPVPLLAILLTAGGLVVAITRGSLTLATDRAAARQAMVSKQNELRRFQSLVEASNDFIAIALTDGTVIYVNPAGRRLVGLDPDTDVTTTSIGDYLTEEGRQRSLEIEQPAVVADGYWTGLSTLRDLRGGPPTPVAISSFVMHHPDTGEPWALATVQRDVTDRVMAQRSLQKLADQRQELLKRLVQAQEDERARIAADVHDDSVQAMAAVELRLGLLHRRIAGAAPEALADVEELQGMVGGATERLRHLLFDLESPALRDDLATALEEAAAYVFEDALTWSLTGGSDVDLPSSARVTAYRIAKEAMVNIRKHAAAERVLITLRRVDGGVEVTVGDDGRGGAPFPGEGRAGHLGISSMRDRATVAGGWVALEERPGGGTLVRLWLPDRVPDVAEQLLT